MPNKKSSGDMSGFAAAAANAAFLNAVFLFGVPRWRPPRLSPGFDPLGMGLPWSSAGDRFGGVSETFGTVRYGRLAEILMYDIRRTQTLAGPSAVYLDLEAK